MRKRLLDLLASPCCRSALTLVTSDEASAGDGCEDEIVAGSLHCACGKSFPIRNGIARFVPSDGYAGSFSLEWRRHGKTQLDRPGADPNRDELLYKTGYGASDLEGKLVLDAGVGAGRFADVVERMGAQVVGFDLADSVEDARENIPLPRRLDLVQADLYAPPLRRGSFEVVYAIGVLNHTPDAAAGFRALAELVAPGGSLAISVYGENRRYWMMIEFWRRWTTRLPPERLYRLTRFVARWVHPLRKFRLLAPIGWIVPIPDTPDLDWRTLNTFNLYAPKYQSKHTYWEVWSWFRDAGFVDLEILPHVVSVRGRRPAENETS